MFFAISTFELALTFECQEEEKNERGTGSGEGPLSVDYMPRGTMEVQPAGQNKQTQAKKKSCSNLPTNPFTFN